MSCGGKRWAIVVKKGKLEREFLSIAKKGSWGDARGGSRVGGVGWVGGWHVGIKNAVSHKLIVGNATFSFLFIYLFFSFLLFLSFFSLL